MYVNDIQLKNKQNLHCSVFLATLGTYISIKSKMYLQQQQKIIYKAKTIAAVDGDYVEIAL